MFLWLLTFYQTGPNGLFIFYQVFNLILQSAVFINRICFQTICIHIKPLHYLYSLSILSQKTTQLLKAE